MTLDQLRIFVAVAERQHMTRAAEALGLAQSAVSRAVAALETRHDVALFDRIGRRVELTEAGRVLLAEARAVLAQVERAELALAEFGGLARGVLTIRASQTIAGYWLPRHLAAFRRAWPGVEIRLGIGNTEQVLDAVERGLAEIGLVEGAVESGACEARVVARDQLVLLVAPDHPWAAGGAPDAEALAGGAWVLRERGSGTRSVFEAALAGMGVDPARLDIRLELPSNEAVRGAVEAGLGATALAASVAAPSLDAGLLLRVPLPLPERRFTALRRADRPATRAASVFLAGLDPRGGRA
ncbi:LysR family transcriptional regulator [Amaricoccus solimangrovi]|uniref:LysR family transcriptional regulator n=1 Tax=Amaricoccus solimangrovi TaxID=2589815 RepID=A0A501WK33_9RHOB|nr:LysR family transcriptional regulator [Amaricoccus solimangrovi]TPE49708.1 LysR family transcriptional regulator [Amaricoccus solimangrovi]